MMNLLNELMAGGLQQGFSVIGAFLPEGVASYGWLVVAGFGRVRPILHFKVTTTALEKSKPISFMTLATLLTSFSSFVVKM